MALYFIDSCVPLTKCDMLELVVHVTGKFINHMRNKVRFPDGTSSLQRLNGFLNCHPTSQLKSMKGVVDECVEATVPERNGKQLARLESALKRYNINSEDNFFNLYECNVPFGDVVCRSRQNIIEIVK